MAKSTITSNWMKENNFSWADKPKSPTSGKKAKYRASRHIRLGRGKVALSRYKDRGTIKSFVEAHRYSKMDDCIFVSHAQKDVPASVSFCGRKITAARYALLLKDGAPKYEGAVARHLCGNGHLSCINPNHLAWGDVSDNVSDDQRHRALSDGATIQDRVESVTR